MIGQSSEEEKCSALKSISYYEFLYFVGMFNGQQKFEELSSEDKICAEARYLNALSASIRGSVKVF